MFVPAVSPCAGTSFSVTGPGSLHLPHTFPELPMASNTATLGRCPVCRSEIPQYRVLIEYERNDERAAYAECPGCRDVVRPN